MDDSTKVIVISALISGLGSIITIIVTKWAEIRQSRSSANDQTKGALALAKFGQEENIRKEMQIKVDRLERTVDRHERLFFTLRDMVTDTFREVSISLQLAIHDINAERYPEASAKITESIDKIKAFKPPVISSPEESKESKSE